VKATALQFYYTSCRRGLSGYAGFQTRAESAGIQLAERRELEGKALYQPPRDLPTEPDADVIAGQFPTAFKFVCLSSGRTALIRSTYAGQDYSGRWGNYFAHGLVLGESLGSRWPIDAYAWPGWAGQLEDGAEESDPEPLPEVPLSEITGGTDFAFEELQTFLGEGDSRQDVLAQMLNAVFRRASDSRSLVIREQLELDAVYWVACIQKAFPPGCQRELNCSTFQFDPRTSLAINATIGETDFLFDEGERKYQFYVFDFVTGQHSEVPKEHAEYSSKVAAWMATEPKRLRGFHDFAALFEYREVGGDLLHLLRLYRLEGGEQVTLSTRDLHAILAFVNAHARPAAFARVLEALGDVTRSIGASAPLQDWSLVIRFLADGAASTKGAEHRRRACQAWVDAFDHFVITKQRAEADIVALRAEVEDKLESSASAVAQALLEDAHLDWMWEQAGLLPSKSLVVVMTEVVRSCRQLGREPVYEAQEVRSLIEAVLVRSPGLPPDLQWAFAEFRSHVEGLSSLVAHVLSVQEEQIREGAVPRETWGAACRAVGHSLAGVLGHAGEGLRFKMVNSLRQDERFADVLFGEWEAAINKATNKVESHADYERCVLSDDSLYALKMRDEIYAALLKILPAEQQRRQAREWVESARTCRLSDEMAGRVLALASQNVKLTPDDPASERLAGQILQELNKRRLRLNPDRLELRTAACRALTDPSGNTGLREVVGRADAASYGEFVGVVLPPLLAATDTPDGHRRVLMSMVVDAHLRAFSEAYAEFLSTRPKERFDHADVAALVFWLRLGESDSAWSALQPLKKSAIETMAIRLGSMRHKERSKAAAHLEKLPALRKPVQRRALGAFLDRADELRPSWLDRLLGRSRS